ncbi:MAG: ATP-dependent helicase HrpB [Sulfitobacter sp.]|jgi:ATP-dependent helicase HrpB
MLRAKPQKLAPSSILSDMITNLPIHAVLNELKEQLRQRDEAVLQAPPGAGKTTIVPLEFLNENWLGNQTILVLEPRRIATRNAAERMAELLGQAVGEQVGYRMRLESKIGPHTQIEVITEGILTRMLQDDPELSGVGMVIFDEFHERSLDADLGLALCLKSREIFRDVPLKLLVMSATLDGKRISSMLNDAPVITSSGRAWPVDVIYGKAAQPRERTSDRMVAAIKSALEQNPDSSLLAFFPGEGEIRQVAAALESVVDARTLIAPLFGSLSLPEQRRAIAPTGDSNIRKVVLATNIAETSITIEGVDVVVDSGLERQAIFDANTAMTRLHTTRISQASATQRAGRAGRLRPGKCYRLWSAEQQKSLAPYTAPEILSADLAPLAMQLLHWGLDTPAELKWLDEPSTGAWQQALALLADLGATASNGLSVVLSDHGELISRLPLPPRLAHMLICGAAINESATACALASLFSDRDPFTGVEQDADIQLRVDILLRKTKCPGNKQGWLNRTRQLAERYQQQLDKLNIVPSTSLVQDAITGYLVASAFPDRIGRRRHAGGFQLANGRSANLPDGDRLSQHRWLAIAEVGGIARRKGDMIRTATPLDADLFESSLSMLKHTATQIEWDKKSGRFIAERQTLVGSLILERANLAEIPETEKVKAICDHVRKDGLTLFKTYQKFNAWRNRVQLVRQYLKPEWPDLRDQHLLDTLESWLGPYLGPISRLDDLKKINIEKIWIDNLGFQKQQDIARLVPEVMSVPSGSKIKINYQEQPPVLAVKLQEMFGCERSPSILDGKVELLIHLLSPAGRPLQVTQDLAGFWQSSYKEVKKEMKGRYPKHPWPDDPTAAVATRHTKKRS